MEEDTSVDVFLDTPNTRTQMKPTPNGPSRNTARMSNTLTPKIELPWWFRQTVYSGRQNNQRCFSVGDTRSLTQRKQDISLAILWLKQEIMCLKEQDKDLVHQYLDIGANIHRYMDDGTRRRTCSCSSGSGTPSPAHSHDCLHTKDSDTGWLPSTLLKADECQVEFRARTVSMLPVRKKPVYRKLIKVYSENF